MTISDIMFILLNSDASQKMLTSFTYTICPSSPFQPHTYIKDYCYIGSKVNILLNFFFTNFQLQKYTFLFTEKIQFSPPIWSNIHILLQKYTLFSIEKIHIFSTNMPKHTEEIYTCIYRKNTNFSNNRPKHTYFKAEIYHFIQWKKKSPPIGPNIHILLQKYTLLSAKKYTFLHQ